MSDYWDGYYHGMKNALRIVKQTESAPNTRCSDSAFGAAQRRISRVLAGAVARNEPVPVADPPTGEAAKE